VQHAVVLQRRGRLRPEQSSGRAAEPRRIEVGDDAWMPGTACAAATSMATIRPAAIVLRTSAACAMPG
jgi:hypothetical protein